MRRHAAAVGALGALMACRDGPTSGASVLTPVIESASVATNPRNGLSAVVAVRVRDADSVAVRFVSSGALGADGVAPAVRTISDSAQVPVLGLVAEQTYTLRPVAYRGPNVVVGTPLTFTTGALPEDLPRYTTSGTGATAGYVVLAAGQFGVVIDNTGRVVWYHRFENGPGLNFLAQPNGRYAARPPTSAAEAGAWVEIDALGNETRTLGCARGLRARLHDFVAQADGSYWLLCDDTRAMNLSAFGGVSTADVIGTVVQHVAENGAILFEWSPFDHFEITDLDARERAGPVVNWTHGNALDVDANGDLIVSFRNLNEVTKIDTRTGSVAWRLGGRRNEFRIEGAVTPSFAGQHSARAYAPGALLLLDNLGDPAQSRAQRYAIDEDARIARLLQSFGNPGVSTTIGGSVQALSDGHTLVSFGTAGRVEEYDASGRVVWQIVSNPGYVFRAQRIRSLYFPGVELRP